MPAAIDHRSEGVGSVSDEAPPMLKSGRISEEPSTAQLGETDSLQTELSKLKSENESLRVRSCELKSENERLNLVMSSWTQFSVSLSKLHETQKPLNDKSGLGFNVGESSSRETSTQSNLVYEKFKKMNFFKASVIHNNYESVKYDDQTSGQLNQKGKSGIVYIRPENSKPSWLKNRLDKEKARSGSMSSGPHQPRWSSTKVKSVWTKVQPRRDLNGPHTKPKLNRSHHIYAHTLMDFHTGKTVKKGDPAVTLEEAKTFPPLEILSAKTVGTYVATNKIIDARGESDDPEVAKVAVVKRKFVSKKRSASTSNKETDERTATGRAATMEKDLALVTVAQDAVPIQIIELISAVPAEPRCGDVAEKQKEQTAVDDVDKIIDQVLTKTAQMETDVVEPDVVEEVAMGTDLSEPVVTRSDDIVVAITEHSIAVNDEDDNLDGAENEIARTMASVTAPKQFLKERLRSGEDDNISGVEKPSKIIDMEEDCHTPRPRLMTSAILNSYKIVRY
ncbi:splicing factor 3B subunit 1-like [Dorcoceras hygrometricum]|uniref:Splicing factor 3B subunit 1-like n=1 Tax=Dorcoceras hygrometricum TaxID=472368 RepID=A0A2Z7ARF8_9LAMI|nr:splicing factor 3B subunit 1-like [Dorcoceras hygrometricum]